MKMWREILVASLLALAGCSGESQTGVEEVHWDRDACERCRMVLSERAYAAQVRYFPPGERSRVALFDDFGCAVLWLRESSWQAYANTEFWVADHRSGEWLNARQAVFVAANNTPMAFGLGAQRDAADGGIDFDQAVSQVLEVEARNRQHQGHQHHHPAEGVAEPPPIAPVGDRP